MGHQQAVGTKMRQNEIEQGISTVSIQFAIVKFIFINSGLENSTRPLVFTSVSGCRASENFVISSEI